MEDWVTIRNMKKRNPELGSREIGKILRVSKNTVKKALRSESPPEYKRKEIVNPDIEPFAEHINEKLQKGKLIKSRILCDIISKGYKGSKSAFYRYASKIDLPSKRTYQPYETAPGEQSQFDWSEYSIVVNGILTRVYVFSYILGYSRYRVYEASLSQSQGSVFEALENSLQETGGVPGRIQTDNAGSFVINASRNNLQWNPRYLHFCGYYGIEPTRSLPKHPWSKGKVERPFHYLEEHFIKGNEFGNFEEFYSRLKQFQDEVNSRVHGTTRHSPEELFGHEKSSLGPLPDERFVDVKEEVRKVTSDCLISFQGSRYSVPFLFATKEVWLKISRGHRLQIFSSQNKLIAEHVLSREKGKVIIREEHYKNHRIERGNWERLSQCFLERFPGHGGFLEKLKAQKRINCNYHLTRTLEIVQYYDSTDVREAIEACMKHNVFTYIFIRGYLENRFPMKELRALPIDRNILLHSPAVDIKRPLSEYGQLDYGQKTEGQF